MHTPEYTKTIKALLAARQALELNLNSATHQFRNGRKPYADNIAVAKKAFSEAMAILEPQGKDARREDAITRAQQENKTQEELTAFTVIYKQGNTIDTFEFPAYTLEDALAFFHAGHIGNQFHVLGIMPTAVFDLLPDASVFFGIFPY